jgi:hypothetical protein
MPVAQYIFMFVLLLVTSPVWATDYFVSTNGNNANPGTVASGLPWRTITGKSNLLACGDRLYVRGGTYSTEGQILFAQTCTTVGNEVQLIAANLGPFPSDSTPLISWTGSNLDTSHRVVVSFATGIIIHGIEWFNGHEHKVLRSTRITWRKNIIRHFGENAIGTGSEGGCFQCVVDQNSLYDNGNFNNTNCSPTFLSTCNQYHGMYVSGQQWVITNNLIYDNLGYGIQWHGQANSVCTANSIPSTHCGVTATVTNNTFAYSRNRAAMTLWNQTSGSSMVITAKNNIFFENSQSGTDPSSIRVTLDAGNVVGTVIQNNIQWATGVTLFNDPCSGCTISGNAVNVAPASATMFVNAPATVPASPDFHLNAANNFGQTLSVNYDFDANTRTVPWDAGAYEFGSTPPPPPDTTPPAAPTGLTVQ